MADLKNLFRTAVSVSMDNRGKPAKLGKVDGTLYYSSSRRDMVWARIGEDASNQEAVVRCTKVTPQVDMPVRVDTVNGVMTVVDVDDKRYLEFSGNRPGGSVGAHAWLHGRLGPDPLYVTGLQYLPLLVRPSNPAVLTVTVEQGAYRWEGTYKIFEQATSGSLSSYVPGSSSVKHFVIICLDRVNNTIVIVDGDDVSGGGDALFGTITLTPDEVEAISIDATYLPLAAILLYNGQTEVRAADIVMDLRPWGGEDFVGAAGIPEPTNDDNTYGRMTTAGGTSSWVAVVPAAGGTFSGGLAVSSGGLAVEGGSIYNDVGADVDHRWESSGNANMLFIDGGNNRLGVGAGDPNYLLEAVQDGGQGIIAVSGYDDSAQGSQFIARKSRGSKSSPTAIQANDAIGLYPFQGHDGSAFGTAAAIVVIANQTWTGSAHGARMDFRTVSDSSTTLSIRMRLYEGLQVGSPTGGDKGAGTINAQALYDDNLIVSDYLFDLYYDGVMSAEDRVLHSKARLWSIEETAVFTKANHHLPTMPGRKEWEKGSKSVGELVTALWETVEQQQIMIFELSNKLKAVTNG